MIIAYIVLGLIGTLSIILLTGHGAVLIAGYNTSSPEDKAKYDIKKLCRTLGFMLLLITAAIAGLILIPSSSVFSTPYFIFFFIFIIVDISIALFYANTRCFKKGYKTHEKSSIINNNKKTQDDTSGNNRIPMVIGICIAAFPVILLVGIVLYQSSQPPVFSISNDTLKISSAFGETISLRSIKSLQIENRLPKNLNKISGSDFGSILKGRFKADGKEAEVYINAARPPYLYMVTTDDLIIFNDQNQGKTEALYNRLLTAIK